MPVVNASAASARLSTHSSSTYVIGLNSGLDFDRELDPISSARQLA
ncbi:uncharacterized protein CLUP02_11432 [Colletotrichum lupini]|uniref:Uncharacterized protein n=1 Tax=Colletotrichum lupini TaxID=145971 RepID=A0A9Q8SYL1_9PEZI|nr:uncharacterized protein CLUP02_11432 [Colletotrichum lupini]UQC85933.1 hypothetical protein CLUP02_11432 [Colletotrichum lupini]